MICPFCFSEHDTLLKSGIKHDIFKLLDIVGGGYRDCLCPTCFSSDRERLVYVYLVDYFKVFKRRKLRILHVAPERCIYHFLIRANLACYSVGSLDKTHYPFVKEFLKIDITKTSFQDCSFDLIICNHVLEHVIEEHLAMNEFKRILKRNGKAILQVPIAYGIEKTIENKAHSTAAERLKHYGQEDHVRLYGRDYEKRLIDFGIEVQKYKLFDEYPLLGLNEREILYVASK